MQAAEELKFFHESDGLLVHIVTDQQIFNEFSSGMRCYCHKTIFENVLC